MIFLWNFYEKLTSKYAYNATKLWSLEFRLKCTTLYGIKTYLDHGKLSWNNLTPRFSDLLTRKWHKNHDISADICPGILPEVTGSDRKWAFWMSLYRRLIKQRVKKVKGWDRAHLQIRFLAVLGTWKLEKAAPYHPENTVGHLLRSWPLK